MNDKESLKNEMKYLLSSIEGKVLIFLVMVYLLLFFYPEIAAAVFKKAGFLSDKSESRLVFILMPLVLFSEFMWFSAFMTDNRNRVLTIFALLVTAAIPFMNIYK